MSTQIESMAAVQKLAGGELSLRARLGYVVLLLVAAGMTTVIVSLWLTEPYLPLRAQLAFGVMTLIGVSWAALSVWVLNTRRILLARDSVIAGHMAVTFTFVFVVGAIAACVMSASPAAFGALATGLVMLGVALRVLARARRRHAALLARREILERELGKR